VDGGRAARSAVKVCTVSVSRIPNPPVLVINNPNVTILEIQNPGEVFNTISVTTGVSAYFLFKPSYAISFGMLL
jgi:hypothetical protein